MSFRTFSIAPHVIPYQGSKRKIAAEIVKYIPFDTNCLYEPFVGSAAITLSAAANRLAKQYVIGDKLDSLSELWQKIIDEPRQIAEDYYAMYTEQLSDPLNYYLCVRNRYNTERSPSALLFLIARCVKNSIRFNSSGEFNQSADKRRLGMHPQKLLRELLRTSALLKGHTRVVSGDFRHIIRHATKRDFIYMDPPWQGTSGPRDSRYAHLLDINELIAELESLNKRGIPFVLSFDGTCGVKAYGNELPSSLNLLKVSIAAGRSTQATLLGRDEQTVESLYLSPGIEVKSTSPSAPMPEPELMMF